ncbi:TetR/AcrR family transcriptional regulator [Rhodococcus sp. OK302]|uniref:TetR/AcrR family transcriptional regulator n=1 Tax=Rhodococcus sp. OK302 TaxID=1882769 RepID=UPI000B9F186D|nr:TetR/AcrR family transcriptional regulator [Rhodococcus sp. OK302]OYD70699.1 TetR family transcriptional regulator [Rhodococcus sp. OK302]
MTPTNSGNPPLRGRAREAQNNDDSILKAAREVFYEYGWGAPMSDIAARAGIGVASIYRRYPSKPVLVNALRILALEQIIELADTCAATAETPGHPDSAVEIFLHRNIVEASAPLVSTFGRHMKTNPEIDALADRLEKALESVIAVDRRLKLIPDHYGPADIMLTIMHLRPNLPVNRERSNEIHLRELSYVLCGLRAVATEGSAVAGKPSSWQEWLQLNSING